MEVLFLVVPSGSPLPEEIIEGQVNIKARPLTEFEISVKATGSCFKGVGSKVGDEHVSAKIFLGGLETGMWHVLQDNKASITNGWEVAGKKQRFQTSAAVPRYTDKSLSVEQKESQKVNKVEVQVHRNRFDKIGQLHASPDALRLPKEVLKDEKDDKKFFEYASLSFEAGEICGEVSKTCDFACKVRSLAMLHAVMEQTYISDRRAAHIKRKKELASGSQALNGSKDGPVIDLTADSDSDFEVIHSDLASTILKYGSFFTP